MHHKEQSIIAVDSPPASENNLAFVSVAELLNQQELTVPRVLAYDASLGFLLLSDLGDSLYLPHLTAATADNLYSQAIDSLLKMQQLETAWLQSLARYDEHLLLEEMTLFCDWLLDRHLQLKLSSNEQALIEQTFSRLIRSAVTQPQVFVHRDYHSRNLMLAGQNTPAILDFQDAVVGPISYDLVSLLKDCYIRWPQENVSAWCRIYHHKALSLGLLDSPFDAFCRDFDWMGMQRHIKVLGIFCRLNYRDNKAGYLKDLALTFNYLLDATVKYPELNDFYVFLNTRVKPGLFAAIKH